MSRRPRSLHSRAAIGVSAIVLQIYNIAVWNWFWPFFAGIVVHLMAAMIQFMRIVLLPTTRTQ
jgi:hypothetical protein